MPNTCHLRIGFSSTSSIVLCCLAQILSNLISSLFQLRRPWTSLMAARLVDNLKSCSPQPKTLVRVSDLYCLYDAELVIIILRRVAKSKRFAFKVHCCRISQECLLLKKISFLEILQLHCQSWLRYSAE